MTKTNLAHDKWKARDFRAHLLGTNKKEFIQGRYNEVHKNSFHLLHLKANSEWSAQRKQQKERRVP
jgi:hypothetical protein